MTNASKAKQSRQEPRRLSKAERRALERRRQQRRTLAYALGGVAVIAAIVAVLVTTMGDETGNGSPAPSGQVEVSGPARTSLLGVGEEVPAFSAPAYGGGRVEWTGGSPAVLSVWAPWCPHCQVELPILARVAADYPDVDLVTVATAVDQQAGPTVEEYMTDNALSFPVALDDADGTLASALGIQGFPTIFFVNTDGTIAQVAEGEVAEEDLRAIIDSLG